MATFGFTISLGVLDGKKDEIVAMWKEATAYWAENNSLLSYSVSEDPNDRSKLLLFEIYGSSEFFVQKQTDPQFLVILKKLIVATEPSTTWIITVFGHPNEEARKIIDSFGSKTTYFQQIGGFLKK